MRPRLLSVRKSDKPTKKLVAVFETGGKRKEVHFGAEGCGDFVRYSREDRQLARRKRAAYIARHGATEDWKDPTTPATLARYVLWEKPRLDEAVRAFRRRFRV